MKYGWKRDLPDYRDFLYSAVKPKIKLAEKVNLTKACSDVEDQKNIGSCTAQALAGNLEFAGRITHSLIVVLGHKQSCEASF